MLQFTSKWLGSIGAAAAVAAAAIRECGVSTIMFDIRLDPLIVIQGPWRKLSWY